MEKDDAIVQKFIELRDEPIKILVIEDSEKYRIGLGLVFSYTFPSADIVVTTSDQWLNINAEITEGNYDLILTDGNLTDFKKHPTYKKSCMDVIPFIKEFRSQIIVIAISEDAGLNNVGLRAGAYAAILKNEVINLMWWVRPKNKAK